MLILFKFGSVIKTFVVVASKVKLKRFHCHVLIVLTHVYVRQANFTTLSPFEIAKFCIPKAVSV